MSMEPKQWTFYSRREDGTWNPELFSQINAIASAFDLKAIELTVKEIVHWDIAKMRGFLHAKVIPAFRLQFSQNCQHPKGGKFTDRLVKNFLKARFLGYQKNAAYQKWRHVLQLDSRTFDIFDFIALQDLMEYIVDPPEIVHTEKLTALEYWNFVDECDKYYFELFHDSIDKREKPEKPVDEQSSVT